VSSGRHRGALHGIEREARMTCFDIPTWAHPKVAPDRHVQVAKALYSVPGELVGCRLDARVDAHGETVLAR
jgi:hypothetical protein